MKRLTLLIVLSYSCVLALKSSAQTIDFTPVLPAVGPQFIPEFSGVYNGDSEAFDADGDGDKDLLILGKDFTAGQNLTRLYLNDGAGNYSLSTSQIGVFIDVFKGAVTTGDVDADGDIDVLITGESTTTHNTKLYLNNGSGNFSLSPIVFENLNSSESKFVDIDGDLDLDLILSGWRLSATGFLATYVNDGSGNFTWNQTISSLWWGSNIVVSDVDIDGDIDFFISGLTGVSASDIATSLYLNNGTGTYTLDTQNTFESLGGSVSVADTDDDGDLDFIISGQNSSGSSKLKIYLNDGSGIFADDLNAVSIEATHYGEHALGDIDQDGDQDLIITGLSSTLAAALTQVYYNNAGIFTLDTDQSLSNYYYSSIELFDVDANGDLDFVVNGQVGSGLKAELYYNDGNGKFFNVTGTPFTEVQRSATAVADVDDDGDLDLFISGESDLSSIASLYLNLGNNVFELSSGQPFVAVKNSSAEFFDADNDGDMDLIVIGGAASSVTYLYLNDGDGLFSVDVTNSFEQLGGGDIAVGDLNNDGNPDLILAGSNGTARVTKLYLGNGSGVFSLVSPDPFTGFSAGDLSLGDVDGDGDLDVFSTGYQQTGTINTAKLYTNNGSVSFTHNTSSAFIPVDASANDFADIDGDGDLDLIVTGRASGNVPSTNIYLNDGNGLFTIDASNTLQNVNSSAVKFADLDNDGDSDIVLTGSQGTPGPTTKVYANDGNGLFSEVPGLSLAAVSLGDLKIADMNNDAKEDIILTGFDSDRKRTVLYENISCNLSGLQVIQNGGTLEASIAGDSYQWIDCNNGNSIITGEDGMLFTPTANGNYAVEVTLNTCTSTSPCYAVTTVSVMEFTYKSLSVYPNPSKNEITISGGNNTTISVVSVTGAVLSTIEVKEETTLDVSSYSTGVYFIRTAEGQTVKFIKE